MRFDYAPGYALRVPWPLVGISMLVALVVAWIIAEATGHWVSEVPAEMSRLLHQHIGSIVH